MLILFRLEFMIMLESLAVATAVNDFYPDTCNRDNNGRLWLSGGYKAHQSPSVDFPKSVTYESRVYYYMSFNSDSMLVSYAAKEARAWHERYCD
jgi:hypothetical protein